MNAMSVDVEDYFQVSAFEPYVSRDDWDAMPCRVEQNTERVLRLFDEHQVSATFFTLGWVAERFPELVRRMVDAGHELASHGCLHIRANQQTKAQFRDDVERSKKLLEDVSGQRVCGYRAPSYSIGADNLWAQDVLAEAGYLYSSSIYPIRHDHYGMPDAPRFAHRSHNDAILEIPISTVRMMNRNFPSGGGGYFRLLPYAVSRWAMRRINDQDGQPCVFYFHPWEIDPDQPRQDGLSRKTRFRHYLNLDRMEDRLHRLLSDFHWDRMDRIFMTEGGI